MAGHALHRLAAALALALTAGRAAAFLTRPRSWGRSSRHQDRRAGHREPPPQQQGQNATGEPFRQIMENYEDLQYYGSIQVGGQRLHGVFDSGSIELVVISDKCNHWCGKVQNLYHATQSGTYQRGKYALNVSYGSGDLHGTEAYDTVSIGPFRAKDTPFWEVTDSSMPVLTSSDFEAIIGLGPIAPGVTLMRPGKANTNNSYAVVLDRLDLKKYSLCLMRDPGMPGYITWNDHVHEQKPHLFNKLSVHGGKYWMLKLHNVTLGDSIRFCEHGCGAIIDSGTSLLGMPHKSHSILQKFLKSFGRRCSNLNLLPDLHFVLDGVQHTLPPDSYLAQVKGHVPHSLFANFQRQSARCQPALMQMALNSSLGDTWILGMPFLRSYYTVFDQTDREKPGIFTARASDECTPMDANLALTLQPRRAARVIDASKLRMPSWARSRQMPDIRKPQRME